MSVYAPVLWSLHRSVENTLSIVLFSVNWLQSFVNMYCQVLAPILGKNNFFSSFVQFFNVKKFTGD